MDEVEESEAVPDPQRGKAEQEEWCRTQRTSELSRGQLQDLCPFGSVLPRRPLMPK